MNSGTISKEDNLKQLKSKAGLKDLKSDYILTKLFDMIKKNKLLNIMKYNKNLQKRLNLNNNDYKNYAPLLSPIEIELKLDDNEINKNNKFINIPEEVKEYYHIYFDGSNEEIKRDCLEEKEKVNIIKIIIDHQVKSFKELFFFCDKY